MKKKSGHQWFKSIAFLTMALVLFEAQPSYADEVNFSLVSGSDIPPIESKFARKYLSGQKATWPDGTPVVLILLPTGSPEMTWLCKSIIKMPEPTYRRFVMEKSLRAGLKIIEVETTEEAVLALKEHSGSIAPISTESVAEDLFSVDLNKQ